MTNKKIRWGILGVHFISEVLAKAIQESEYAEVTAIGSRSLEKAKQFSDNHSIAKYYGSYDEVLSDPKIDAVYIALPIFLHKEWIIKCAEAKKHILCEKSLTTSIKNLEEIMHACEQNNVLCMEALMYRHHPFIKELKAIIENKIVGEIQHIHTFYSAPILQFINKTAGGGLLDLGCYPLSLVQWLMNEKANNVIVQAKIHSQYQCDTQCDLMLQFSQNKSALISTNIDLSMQWSFEVFATNGNIKLLSNPWLPEKQNNKMLILRNGAEPNEINVNADKTLYSYQVDLLSHSILANDPEIIQSEGISWRESHNNIAVIEDGLAKIKNP